MLRHLYHKTLALAGHKFAGAFLFLIAFIESSLFPIPPDVLLIPMILARRERTWLYAGLCTVGSVLGGLFGYAMGFWFFTSIGSDILDFYGYLSQFINFQSLYQDYGAWIVGGAGFTPFPYKVITIASGAVGLNLITFLIASSLSRGIRFFLLATLLWYFGPTIKIFIEKYLGIICTVGFIILIGGFVSIKYIF